MTIDLGSMQKPRAYWADPTSRVPVDVKRMPSIDTSSLSSLITTESKSHKTEISKANVQVVSEHSV